MRKAALIGAILTMIVFTTPAFCQTWQPVPLVTAAMRAKGHMGGEGAQWPRAIAVDGTGNFLLFGSDVGGIYRSFNGGVTWEPCSVGYNPRGTAGMAIDPRNPKRCLSVGANSVASDFNGLYLSTDGAASWHQVFKANMAGSDDNREQIAYDATSFDAKASFSRIVYWSRIAVDKPHWGDIQAHPALYKSTDGGETWNEVPGTAIIGGSRLKVHPTKGIVYAANGNGFYRSFDGGVTWTRTFDGDCTGLDVSRSVPDGVWLSRPDGVYVSHDAGATFAKIEGSAAIANGDPLRNVHVSPADANHLILWREGANWQWPRFASNDGGKTWTQAKFDNTNAFLPYNARQGLFAMHPTNPNVEWSTGGDWPTKSTDGGQTWAWSGDGYNVVLVGGKWNFNAQNPDVLFVGSQDYNGAVTRDGGQTWQYTNVSGNGWGGFVYGAYAASSDVLLGGDAPSWGGPRHLKISHDGGQTFADSGQAYGGPDVACGDPTDAKVIFASNLRSADGGQTWQPMTGCDAVFSANPQGAHELYGRLWNNDSKQSALLVSHDEGATWATLATIAGGIDDIAYDSIRNRAYVVNDGALKVWSNDAWTTIENLPKDQWNGNRINSVAVDPTNPAIVYATSNRDVFSTSAAVLRSTDAGATWQNLTLSMPLNGTNKDGGREAICVRVHPRTRKAWVSTSCYGIWKIGPPK